MINQTQVLIGQSIDICGLFNSATASAMLKHTFHDRIGAFTVVEDLAEVLFDVFRNGEAFFRIPFFQFVLHVVDQFGTDLGKIVDEVLGVLDLVGDAGGEFTEGGHFLRLYELLLG